MKLEIYYDLQFFSIMIVLFCTMKLTDQVLGRTAGNTRIFMGSVFGALAHVLIAFLPLRNLLKESLWFLLTCVVICVVFRAGCLRIILKVLEKYWISSAVWGCAVSLIYRIASKDSDFIESLVGLMCMEILATLFGMAFIKSTNGKMGRRDGRVVMEQGKTRMEVNAFVDTGNSLYEPISGKPVCLLRAPADRVTWMKEELFRIVPYRTAGVRKGILQAYNISRMYLELGGPVKCVENVYVAIVETDAEDSYEELVVHPKILLEMAKGKGNGKGRKHDHAACVVTKDGTMPEMAGVEKTKHTDGRSFLCWRNGCVTSAAGTGKRDSNDQPIGNGSSEGSESDLDRAQP